MLPHSKYWGSWRTVGSSSSFAWNSKNDLRWYPIYFKNFTTLTLFNFTAPWEKTSHKITDFWWLICPIVFFEKSFHVNSLLLFLLIFIYCNNCFGFDCYFKKPIVNWMSNLNNNILPRKQLCIFCASLTWTEILFPNWKVF